MSIMFKGFLRNFIFSGDAHNLIRNSIVNHAIHIVSTVSNIGWSISRVICLVTESSVILIVFCNLKLGNVLITRVKVETITNRMEIIVVALMKM